MKTRTMRLLYVERGTTTTTTTTATATEIISYSYKSTVGQRFHYKAPDK